MKSVGVNCFLRPSLNTLCPPHLICLNEELWGVIAGSKSPKTAKSCQNRHHVTRVFTQSAGATSGGCAKTEGEREEAPENGRYFQFFAFLKWGTFYFFLSSHQSFQIALLGAHHLCARRGAWWDGWDEAFCSHGSFQRPQPWICSG